MKFFQLAALSLLMLTSVGTNAAEVDEPAPDFQLEVLGVAGVGSLADYRGKIILLDFWASWCGPCRKSLPLFNEMYADLRGREFEIIAINTDEDPADGLRFLERYPVDYLVLKDPGTSVPPLYRLKVMPSSYLIDKNGVIRKIFQGFREGEMEEVRTAVEGLLNAL
jgi:thiol-disulfide isomerase/thioredoxin